MTPIEGSPTPWGPVQQFEELAPGIVQVSTAGHGGIWVSAERLEKMPVKRTAFSQGGWFEEDVDWALVAIAFPEAFERKPPIWMETARSIVGRHWPELLAPEAV
jgi:hypothetical protein